MTADALTRFAGRTALLTAAASGIGAATAHRLAAEGATVLVTDVDGEGAHRVAEEIRGHGGRARGRRLDVTSPGEWDEAVEEAVSWTGRLDVLHLNAGHNLPAPVHDLDDATWHDQLRLCLDSVFYGVRAALPRLREAGGSVVVTSSVHAVLGFRDFPAYAAAKAGIGGLVRQLAVEYGGQVRFNAVLPGSVFTPPWADAPPDYLANAASRAPAGRLGTPQDVAAAVAYLASDDAAFVTGQSLAVDGGRSISAQD
ncbi:SDR family NAD(P)-dependent oxidoreductase [Streptomyces sp. NPDC057257]|uniref:SDR family NAD(P)-dependent oxidoreductase n=1 Tax=Streptomyces sp. NPDC057257 TaxID=3346071 RepID=UPI00363DCEA0